MKLALDRYRILRELARGKSVLDVGCVDHTLKNRAHSVWLHDVLRSSARKVVGLDAEVESVRELQAAGYDVRVADATAFRLAEQFDLVVAGELLEHLPDAAGFLESVRKHLGPDGRLVLTTPNAMGLIYAVQNLFLGHEVDNPDHVCFYTPRTLSRLLEKCGFVAERFVYLAGFRPLGHASLFLRGIARLKNVLKLPLLWLRPSLAHRFLAVAKVRTGR